jgi:hypothetical protein
MFKKYLPLVSSFLLLAIIFSLWFYPFATPALGVAFLLFTFAISILPIIEKHKTSENPRQKIIREVARMMLTLMLVLVIGGVAGLLAGQVAGAYVEIRWQGFGMAAGLVSALIVSFAVGYAVRWGVGKLGGG